MCGGQNASSRLAACRIAAGSGTGTTTVTPSGASVASRLMISTVATPSALSANSAVTALPSFTPVTVNWLDSTNGAFAPIPNAPTSSSLSRLVEVPYGAYTSTKSCSDSPMPRSAIVSVGSHSVGSVTSTGADVPARTCESCALARISRNAAAFASR